MIYTGGTVGMVQNQATGRLEPFKFEQLMENLPELKRFGFDIDTVQFSPPIDSSDVDTSHWEQLVKIISEGYGKYDGFVVLHGTDTMSYTASALSFMLEGLSKPVILTGSQLPIGVLRTDGKENLITAVEIAAARNAKGEPLVPEVCLFFKSDLMRGNRTTKVNIENFSAFRSYNYPPLAAAGVHIRYNEPFIRRGKNAALTPHFRMDTNVAVLRIFPGITEQAVAAILSTPNLKGLVLETFGSGNAPRREWLVRLLKSAAARGVVVVNISQCPAGSVNMRRYETGQHLLSAGVLSGYDCTAEAALTKLMFLFGKGLRAEEVRTLMEKSISGEVTVGGEE
jgi:L-asparaginase